MAYGIREKMTPRLCCKIFRLDIKWSLLRRVSVVRQFFRFLWVRILACSTGKPARHSRLTRRPNSLPPECIKAVLPAASGETCSGYGEDGNLVTLKISLLGDCQIGKTSFVIKYVGDEQEKMCLQMTGLNLMDKTLSVQEARTSYSIWDVGGTFIPGNILRKLA